MQIAMDKEPAGKIKLGRTQISYNVNAEAGPRGYINVGRLERVLSAVAGAGLAAWGVWRLTRGKSWSGSALAAAGGSLLFRGASGHCAAYGALGVGTARRARDGVAAGAGVRVERSITINRPPDEVYAFWHELENLPRFMSHLKSVQRLEGGRSHWVARGPADVELAWDAETINDRQGELIAWKSLANSQVDTAGTVRFVKAPSGRGTEVHVVLKYDPPGGAAGVAVAKLFGQDAEHTIQEDLRHLKQFLEAGEVPTTEGQSSGRARAKAKKNARRAARGGDK